MQGTNKVPLTMKNEMKTGKKAQQQSVNAPPVPTSSQHQNE